MKFFEILKLLLHKISNFQFYVVKMAYLVKNLQFSTYFSKIRFGPLILADMVLVKRTLVYEHFFTY